MASAFFYGTLMHPKILKRVLHNDATHLQICPAILMVGPFPLIGVHAYSCDTSDANYIIGLHATQS